MRIVNERRLPGWRVVSSVSAVLLLSSLLLLQSGASIAHEEIRNAYPVLEMLRIGKKLPKGYSPAVILAYVTGYSGPTNTPPFSDDTAIPPYHAHMGDGTIANPGTAAVNPSDGRYVVPYGTLIYIPAIGWRKAADYCGTCVKERNMRYRIDLWLGMDADVPDEEAITGWYWVIIAKPAKKTG